MGCVSSKQIAQPDVASSGTEMVDVKSKKDGKEMLMARSESSLSYTPSRGRELEDDPYMIEYVLKEWKLADRDNSGRLSLHEITKLLHALNITLKEHVVKERFKKVDKDESGELDFAEFRNFLEELRTRPELKDLFFQYCKNNQPYMTAEDFVLFLHQEQYELTADLNVASELIKKVGHSDLATQLYFTGFSEYITSQENSAYNSFHRTEVYQPMDQPLPHYFIASSHNTYLEGDQLKGNSSVDAYISALKRGCRCVELDCWDGEDGQPIIYHGHTMTSKIKFRDVIQTCKDFGFVASPYPVILSLENHCSLDQQIRMAQILVEVLGDMLPPPFIATQTRPLPSPAQLKHKVLIKGKMVSQAAIRDSTSSLGSTQEVEPPDDDDEEEEADDGANSDPEDDDEAMAPKPKRETPPSLKDSKKIKPMKVTTAKELSDLVHFKSVHFGGFQRAAEKNAPWEVSSFSELKVKKMVKQDVAGLIKYNMEQTSRIYPKGTRFDSSNYMPIPSWHSGCQIVALNYQTKCTPMRLNMGKFWDNGGCGYVLKPATLRSLNPTTENTKKTLNIRLVSGWQLPKESGTPKGEVIDPYVKLRLFGISEDCNKYKSKVVQNNGFNPLWDEKVSFRMARPDLAELIFEIYDQDKLSKDDLIGYSTIPINSIKAGYRSVHLYTPKSVPIPEASILVQFSFE